MRLSKYFVPAFFVVIMITLISGCYNDKEELLYSGKNTINCGTISARFNTDVNPIIMSKCATSGCHDASGNSGGAVLTNYTQVSALSARINQRCVVDKTMPVSGPLSPAEIAIVKCWIESGSPNN